MHLIKNVKIFFKPSEMCIFSILFTQTSYRKLFTYDQNKVDLKKVSTKIRSYEKVIEEI
jgi:hypothetical protein